MVTQADNARGRVFVVDDEPAVCAAVQDTLDDCEIAVRCFIHPAECLAQLRSGRCDLLITDLEMPEENGMDLLREVRELAPWIPVLMVAGYGDIPTAVKAMKCGAVDFIEKPFGKDGFVQEVNLLLERSRTVPLDGFRALTRMEMKVLRLVVKGVSNKEIAGAVKRAVRTVEAHRASVMHKLGVRNLIELIKLASVIGLVDLTTRPGMTEDGLQIDDRLNDVVRPSNRVSAGLLKTDVRQVMRCYADGNAKQERPEKRN